MKIIPYPGLEDDVRMYSEDLPEEEAAQIMAPKIAAMLAYRRPETIEAIDFAIPGPDEGQQIPLHILKSKNAPEHAPVVIDFHGGGWTQGEAKADDSRNCQILEHIPCIFVAPDYRLSNEAVHFPAPHEDALAVYRWAIEHIAEYGGDPKRIALYGTSAGGNLAAGLQLRIRDLGLQQPSVCIFNCPAMGKGMDFASKRALGKSIGPANTPFALQGEYIYEPATGQAPSYYAFPYYCPDVSGLGPTEFILGEYDPLRSEALEYACRVLQSGSPTEIHVVSGVSHAFCGNLESPLTHHVVRGIAATLRRWFGMEIVEF
jgi:acetyl esterase